MLKLKHVLDNAYLKPPIKLSIIVTKLWIMTYVTELE